MFEVVLSVFCVSSSWCCGLVWRLRSCFSSHTLFDYYTFRSAKIKGLIRLHDCAGFSVPSFFMCNARSIFVDITYLNVYWYFVLPFVFRETPKRVLLPTVKAKMKCSKISCISLGSILLKTTNDRRRKRCSQANNETGILCEGIIIDLPNSI